MACWQIFKTCSADSEPREGAPTAHSQVVKMDASSSSATVSYLDVIIILVGRYKMRQPAS